MATALVVLIALNHILGGSTAFDGIAILGVMVYFAFNPPTRRRR